MHAGRSDALHGTVGQLVSLFYNSVVFRFHVHLPGRRIFASEEKGSGHPVKHTRETWTESDSAK